MFSRFTTLAMLASSQLVQGMLPIHVTGDRFILPTENNEADENTVFFIKGVDYQPGGSSGYTSSSGTDLLSDPAICARDAFVFQQLGINTIRIYSLNPDVNHDKCMTILNNAGIYVILDVNTSEYGQNLDRSNPSGTYTSDYLKHVFEFIEAFKNYPNVIGFFSGNEIINDDSDYASIDPPYIRAVQRDMKEYIAKNSNRTIPVGYSAADNTDLRGPTFEYLQCTVVNGTYMNTLDVSKSDFFGLNTYEWCSGVSDWSTSGYDVLNSTFTNGSIPAIFSEFGCNTVSPRTFDEISDGLYSGLINTFSGGFVYEYSEEANEYGLVEIDSDGNIQYKDDFDNLQSQYQNVSLPTIYESSVTSFNYTCNSTQITDDYSDFGVDNFEIPDQPSAIASMISNGINATNVGKILTDYDAPTTFNYTIKDSDGNLVSATITYAASNKINDFGTTVSSTSSQATSSSSSSSSSTSSSKSKGGASVPAVPSAFVVIAGIISSLL